MAKWSDLFLVCDMASAQMPCLEIGSNDVMTECVLRWGSIDDDDLSIAMAMMYRYSSRVLT